ncbi:MAG: hypothetical protein KF886_12550 [Candidatus Hydrogenedentes bacterium]|nr:hypothetical protein [Candidatus Hydrogenedentota bacterium]
MEIGTGSHRYRVLDRWGHFPESLKIGTTHAVVEDRQGRIFIHHTGPECTVICDPDGEVLSHWGATWHAGAHGMILNAEADGEFLYCAATSAHAMVKTRLDGEEVLRIGTPPRSDIYDADRLFVPTETAVAGNGDIYIADGYGQSWIHRYSKEGEYIDSFGGPGDGPGQLSCPHGLKVDRRSGEERLLVADRRNVRLQYFTLDGACLSEVNEELRFPCTVNPWNDELYIPDLHSRITIFDRDDRLIAHLGDRPDCWKKEGWPNLPESDWVPGAFSSPHDLHVDRSGTIYVAEWMSNEVGKITKLVRL